MHKPAVTAAAIAALVTSSAVATALPASAATPPVSAPHVVAHLDLKGGQQPENITLLPDGSSVVTFALSRRIAHITTDGTVHVLATLPAPAAGSTTPVLTSPFLGGIVRAADGTFYFNYATGSADLTGVWKLRLGHTPHRIAALPADGLPNGLALDSGHLYAADSVRGTIWRVPLRGGSATAWSVGTALAPTGGFLGANGIKVHRGAVWVSNSDQGTVLRIPVGHHGKASKAHVVARDLPVIDDFAFTGRGDTLLAALDRPNEVALVKEDRTHTIVLNGQDGLQSPTSIAVRGNTFLVANAAYNTNKDPNLLQAKLTR
ncbi:SMP-30/gluconolactonase/LRE family protein [Streptomyces sp. NBC_00582]|uniref:SMP-30/gluconolactonase/LRE family protein n=1 Tax=Streptomyces sp. NBC_00582 TaxID=2975783 RepID=UPI002E80266B|nr:hypothetical protein [Streptomyces sp. NBC_00582]WUB58995.1 hypothetical protein OG852_00270 [Streptomyces sp. NBC_00582]WUB67732.1 hypothetical protein OG852_48865 [Streptomyces sp. NBC_00582]